jgi:hypothetical protein
MRRYLCFADAACAGRVARQVRLLLASRLRCATGFGLASALGLALLLALTIPARAVIYEGHLDLSLTAALVTAGGGPEHFSSQQVFALLTGSAADAEKAKLIKQFGAERITNAFAVFDFAIDDTIRIAGEKHIALPAPYPDPSNPKALALALYAAGRSGSGKWDVGYMLEHLISHPIHHAIMHDMDAKFGAANNASFHVVLTQIMTDLAGVYGSAAGGGVAH